MTSPIKTAYKHEHALANVLDYQDDDLIANQNGGLGTRQRQTLHLNFYRDLLILCAGALTWFGFSIVISLLTDAALAVALIICGLMLLNRSQRLIPLWKLYRDLRSGEVVSDEGVIHLVLQRGSSQGEYSLQLDDHLFPVSQAALLTFKNGDPYRLYYLPKTKLLLSAEWLRDDQPFDEEPNE